MGRGDPFSIAQKATRNLSRSGGPFADVAPEHASGIADIVAHR